MRFNVVFKRKSTNKTHNLASSRKAFCIFAAETFTRKGGAGVFFTSCHPRFENFF